jgi:hypothetical protein
LDNNNGTSSSNPASASTSLFLENAEKLASRLEQEKSGAAQLLAREARELAAQFFMWQSKKPEGSVRVARIQQLFDLNRRAMDLLSQSGGDRS